MSDLQTKKCLAHTNYVLITPARNEEAFIEQTILSVISQTILPRQWVIVSDRSTDKTDSIVEKYLPDYPFMQLIKSTGDNNRNFGSQVRAINKGYDAIKGTSFDFIGNLDADISFGPTYYESILNKFFGNPRLGLAGGFLYEPENGVFKPRTIFSLESVPHAIQLFRREVYESIGGYIPLKYGGADWHAEVMSRMKGWEVQTFQEIPVHHHKPASISPEGALGVAFRQGKMSYNIGSDPLFEILKIIKRLVSRPYILFSLYRLAGFASAYLWRETRGVNMEFMRYIRKEQKGRLCRW